MTDKSDSSSTPAPAVVPNAPAVESPAPRQEVDLSDLQAEMDASAQKASEDAVFEDINTGTKDAESDDEADKEADEADEADEGKDDEEDATDDTDEDEDKPRNKRSRAARYRDRLVRLEQENAQLRSRAGGSLSKAQIQEHVESIIGPEPQDKDFADYLTYEREHTAWLIDKRQMTRETERSIKVAQDERTRKQADNVELHNERVESFRNRNGEQSAKDFDAVMASAKDARVSPVVEDLILESGNSAHLQYFFARNPKRLDKINRMSERDAAREVGHIEARLSLPQQKVKSAAPKPVSTPKGGTAPASQEAELNSWLKKKYG